MSTDTVAYLPDMSQSKHKHAARAARGVTGSTRTPAPPAVGAQSLRVRADAVGASAPALRLATYALPDSPNILAAAPLLRAGWKFTPSAGSSEMVVSILGTTRAFQLHRDALGRVIVTFVGTPRGLLLRDDSVAHRGLIAHEFILDPAAEVCIVGLRSNFLLTNTSVVALPLEGVDRTRRLLVFSGSLVIEPPHGGDATPEYDSLCAPGLDTGPEDDDWPATEAWSKATDFTATGERTEADERPTTDATSSHDLYAARDPMGLVALAQAVNFVQDTVLDPLWGLGSFLPAWAEALGAEALGEEIDVPAAAVYHALLTNLLRDKDAAGATSVYATIAGVTMNWTAFANQASSEWRATGGAYTMRKLTMFVRTLRAFEPALPPPSGRALAGTVELTLSPPSVGPAGLHGPLRGAHAAPAALAHNPIPGARGLVLHTSTNTQFKFFTNTQFKYLVPSNPNTQPWPEPRERKYFFEERSKMLLPTPC